MSCFLGVIDKGNHDFRIRYVIDGVLTIGLNEDQICKIRVKKMGALWSREACIMTGGIQITPAEKSKG